MKTVSKPICAIHDVKSNAYTFPRPYRTLGEAHRAFEGSCTKGEDTYLRDYPADFSFVHLGEWDEETGVMSCLDKFNTIARASDFVKQA